MNTTLITEEQKYLDKTVKVIDSLVRSNRRRDEEGSNISG